MKTLRTISPIDGSVYMERPAVSYDTAKTVISNLRRAQTDWAALSREKRIEPVLAARYKRVQYS